MENMKPKPAFALITSIVCGFLLFVAARSFAQSASVRSLITGPVDESKLTVLRGNVHPLALAQFDHGVAADNLPMDHMLLVLKRSQAQETALETLMAQQLDKTSPNYHKWLTPQQFGQMFGPSDQDIQKIAAWMVSHGFTIDNVSNGRTVIEFSGDAAQVQSAFHTPIHSYVVNNIQHWANAEEPSIPTALVPAVAGVRSLHNFYPKPLSHIRGPLQRAQATSQSKPRPNYTFGSNGPCSLVQFLDSALADACYMIAPGDFEEIYTTQTAVNNTSGGSGVNIAIVSDSQINLTDVSTFRSLFNLAPENFIVTQTSSTSKNSDETEAVLDSEWSAAVAPSANINLVVSPSTNSVFGGDISAVDIIDNNLGDILSYSYGACEPALTSSYTVTGAPNNPYSSANAFYAAEWQQAATQGITVIVASGDNGSAGCDVVEVNAPSSPASGGLQVNGIASTPYNVAVGGTDFNDLSNPGNYFGAINSTVTLGTSSTPASTTGYIPEAVWNESCTNSVFVSLGEPDAETACNDPTLNADALAADNNTPIEAPIGSSGGASTIYAKPCWQGGPTTASCTQTSGVTTPNDNARDLPDVSFFAGDGTISASFYYLCQSDLVSGSPTCSLSQNIFGAGGTSVSAQAFAGVMALIVEAKGKQGNVNPTLYSLAAGAHGSAIFNQVTTGTNAMPCKKGSPNCVVSAQIVGPSLRPGKPANWFIPVAVALLGVFCVGSILAAFAGRPRRWGIATAFVALALLVVTAACGGSSGGGDSGPPPSQDFTIGILTGYNAGAGYNLTTGNGSVNVSNLLQFWP
jgi:subtilase family serine protease